MLGQLKEQGQLVNLLDQANNEHLQNVLNIEFDVKHIEMLPEDSFKIKNLIIGQNLEKSKQLLQLKIVK